MQVKVMIFGVLSDVIGTNMLAIQDIENVSDMKNKLVSNYPNLKDYTYRMAVNQKMVNDNHRLLDNDTVAVMPPFAGG